MRRAGSELLVERRDVLLGLLRGARQRGGRKRAHEPFWEVAVAAEAFRPRGGVLGCPCKARVLLAVRRAKAAPPAEGLSAGRALLVREQRLARLPARGVGGGHRAWRAEGGRASRAGRVGVGSENGCLRGQWSRRRSPSETKRRWRLRGTAGAALEGGTWRIVSKEWL